MRQSGDGGQRLDQAEGQPQLSEDGPGAATARQLAAYKRQVRRWQQGCDAADQGGRGVAISEAGADSGSYTNQNFHALQRRQPQRERPQTLSGRRSHTGSEAVPFHKTDFLQRYTATHQLITRYSVLGTYKERSLCQRFSEPS